MHPFVNAMAFFVLMEILFVSCSLTFTRLWAARHIKMHRVECNAHTQVVAVFLSLFPSLQSVYYSRVLIQCVYIENCRCFGIIRVLFSNDVPRFSLMLRIANWNTFYNGYQPSIADRFKFSMTYLCNCFHSTKWFCLNHNELSCKL